MIKIKFYLILIAFISCKNNNDKVYNTKYFTSSALNSGLIYFGFEVEKIKKIDNNLFVYYNDYKNDTLAFTDKNIILNNFILEKIDSKNIKFDKEELCIEKHICETFEDSFIIYLNKKVGIILIETKRPYLKLYDYEKYFSTRQFLKNN